MRPIIQLRRTWNSITLPPIAVDPGDPGIGGVFGMSAPMGGMFNPVNSLSSFIVESKNVDSKRIIKVYKQSGKLNTLIHSDTIGNTDTIEIESGTYILEIQ